MASTASTSSMLPKPTIGILSIGDMGMGIANLLRAHDYMVYTVAHGRSQSTLNRIKEAQIINLPSDEALVTEADIILSIVPPRDAFATARRVIQASRSSEAIEQRSKRGDTAATGQAPSLIYIDLNAISPKSAKIIHSMISAEITPALSRKRTSSFPFALSESEAQTQPIPITFLDGGIIGGPPRQQTDESWKKPSVVMSGPQLTFHLSKDLHSVLNVKNVGEKIGKASALKACFASLTKGTTALAILAFTTAHTCGVLPELQEHLSEIAPAILGLANGGLPAMPPKAYRWVDEMRQIGETFSESGGFNGDMGGQAVFDGIADVYKLVADHTVLGHEKTEHRKRGMTVDDVAVCVADGVRKRRKPDVGEEELTKVWTERWS